MRSTFESNLFGFLDDWHSWKFLCQRRPIRVGLKGFTHTFSSKDQVLRLVQDLNHKTLEATGTCTSKINLVANCLCFSMVFGALTQKSKVDQLKAKNYMSDYYKNYCILLIFKVWYLQFVRVYLNSWNSLFNRVAWPGWCDYLQSNDQCWTPLAESPWSIAGLGELRITTWILGS